MARLFTILFLTIYLTARKNGWLDEICKHMN